MVTVVLYYYTCGVELNGCCGSVLVYVWCRTIGCCGSVLLYVWCRIKWLLWFCITICVVQDYMVTVVLYYYTCGAGLLVAVVLYYYTCGVELNGYCCSVLLFVWCKTIWLLWFCITIRVV